MKTLITYYSRTGNTKTVGQTLAHALKADIDEIIDVKARMGFVNYMRAARDAKGLRTTRIQVTKNPEEYDRILIGTPVWHGYPTPAIRTYLKRYNLQGKQIASSLQVMMSPPTLSQTK